MPATLSFVTLDVFTATRYTGNPLAIIRVPSSTTLSQSQKQRIAREFNLSESVFLHEQTESDKSNESVRIDIFTAQAEVPFAGHPTVGTANYLLRILPKDGPLRGIEALQAKAGRFGITLDDSVAGARISVAHNVHVHSSLGLEQRLLTGQPRYVAYSVISIVKGMNFILVQLADLDALKNQTGNLVGSESTYTAHTALDEGWRTGLLCTYFYVDLGHGPSSSPSDSDSGSEPTTRHLRTRMFGSREDPATGSAASALASYLSLQTGTAGRYKYHITQGVEMGQRGEISVEVSTTTAAAATEGVVEISEVLLGGSAVLNMQGTLEVPDSDEL
ncbi:hypothetical protein PV08_02015 [Exophiala spinifera]|uniref:Phenazine biosynthesis protein PhzF n=1 Tax=Exophiala spinifera TaxID=91928 RepID=A0A0D2BSN4_9EURO|nr:uncharacterized protein PV08_02015 [Exophiala spinifera]KIW21435.1 hypothetical protein PV08_02015 [Exophiala spinifera]